MRRARPERPPGVVDLASWARERRSSSRPRSDSVERALLELDRMRASGSADAFAGAGPAHLVALYMRLHEHVYGVLPEELSDRKVFGAAVLAAEGFLREQFSGDVERAVDFAAWAWRRERRALARSRPGDGRRRMGWRLQFSPALVTDYRVELARGRKNA